MLEDAVIYTVPTSKDPRGTRRVGPGVGDKAFRSVSRAQTEDSGRASSNTHTDMPARGLYTRRSETRRHVHTSSEPREHPCLVTSTLLWRRVSCKQCSDCQAHLRPPSPDTLLVRRVGPRGYGGWRQRAHADAAGWSTAWQHVQRASAELMRLNHHGRCGPYRGPPAS